MTYERFEDKHSVDVGGPLVTLRKDGHIRFNRDAASLLLDKRVAHVWLLWDPRQNRIAFQPSNTPQGSTYTVGFNDRGNLAYISAKAFFRKLGWSSDESFSSPVQWNEKHRILEVSHVIPKALIGKK